MGGRKRKPWPRVGLIEDSILIAQCIASTHFSKILAGVGISYIHIAAGYYSYATGPRPLNLPVKYG